MKNTFKENLNQKIINGITISAIDDLQQQLSGEASINTLDLYETIQELQVQKTTKRNNTAKNINNNNNNFDYGLALNLFLQKFILENQNELENLRNQFIEKQEKELEITETANPNYYVDKNNNYYIFNENKYIKQSHIKEVLDDSSYKTAEKIPNSEYNIIRHFKSDNSIISIQILNNNNEPLQRFSEIVKILDLKKEVVKKVKRIGYCGKSIDLWADFANLFYTPEETGYYSDNKFNFYKWNYKNAQLVCHKREGTTPGAPNIADYEHYNKMIVRTDYNGAGLNLQFI